MGTRIEAAATAHRLGRVLGRGALYLSDAAAIACLSRGHREPDELDLLINTGIYRDRNTAEPALASIIQDDIGANRGNPPRFGRHGTFSFDVLNGGCGVLTAAQLIDGFVGPGGAQLGMIVAADADPSRTSQGYPFRPAGGALLIAHAPGETGFQRFELVTFPEHAPLFEAELRWHPSAGLLRRGRNVVHVFEAPEFAACCVERASEVARELLASASLPPGAVDLVIASQYPAGFGKEVARRLGIAVERLPKVAPELTETHTTGPIAALEAAIESNQFASARHTLFISAGAGITIGAALYRT